MKHPLKNPIKALRDKIIPCSVVGVGGEEIIVFPVGSGLFDLVSGRVIEVPECDWIINSNDMADVSNDGSKWIRKMFCYINSDIFKVGEFSCEPYMTSDGECYKHIRPVFNKNEEEEFSQRIKSAEESIQALAKEIGLMKKRLGR